MTRRRLHFWIQVNYELTFLIFPLLVINVQQEHLIEKKQYNVASIYFQASFGPSYSLFDDGYMQQVPSSVSNAHFSTIPATLDAEAKVWDSLLKQPSARSVHLRSL